MKNRYKTWIIGVLLASLVIPLIVAGINYFMDPLWCFDSSCKYNKYQIDFNERVQKTNYLTYRRKTYQGILFGSSRSAYISQKAFKGISVFSYCMNALSLEETRKYLEYAKKINGSDFKYIFIGLDFPQSDKNYPKLDKSLQPESILPEMKNPFHRIKTLISIDTLKYSMQNYYRSKIGDRYYYYTRDNIKIFRKSDPEEMKSYFNMFLWKYNQFYKNFKYCNKYKTILRKIKDDHPNSTIVVFSTPECDPLLKNFLKYHLLNDYFRWLSEIIDVFGGCYNFMYPSTVTKNYNEYFADAVHTYPETGDLMVDAMYNKKENNTGFGMYIDRKNFEQKKELLKELFRKM